MNFNRSETMRMIDYLEEVVFNRYKRLSPLDNLDIFVAEAGKGYPGNDYPWYNSWPFGEETDMLYNQFLGVCRGRTGLKETLEEARKYSERVAKGHLFDCAVVTIVTDKWTNNTFNKYAQTFLDYAHDYNITYVFILITDFGYVQIPFLPLDWEPRKYDIPFPIDPKFDNVLFSERSTLPSYSNKYTFNLSKKKGKMESKGVYKTGKLTDVSVKRFLAVIDEVINSGRNVHISPYMLDAPLYDLIIPEMGLDMQWDGPAMNNDPILQEIYAATEHLKRCID